jgi:hypothetical protein
MTTRLKLVLMLFALWTAAFGTAVAAQAYDDSGDPVLVSAEQGQALADFAMQSGPRVRPKPDCSHLVHLLYARAGLIYPYEDSRVLYRGVDDFERVKSPQPGDLAVWLGHVGIVLSPEDKTFLSSVRSGIITESWIAPHWARRGRPRFLRYRIGLSANLTLLAAIMSDGPGIRNKDIATAGGPAAPARSEDRQTEDRRADARNADAENEGAESGPRSVVADATAGDSTAFVAVIHQRKTPSKREIVAAILESGNARAQEFTAGRTLNLDHPISVFDGVEVTRIKMKHESGSVTVKLSETMSQEDGKVLAARLTEREFSMVRRSDGVWTISDPRRRTYLPQAQALGVFESQAEIFLRRAPNSSGTRALVKALDRLYDQLSGPQQRARLGD